MHSGNTYVSERGGVVTVAFDYTLTATNTWKYILTLPSGYRPPFDIYGTAFTNTTSGDLLARTYVGANGDVMVNCRAGTGRTYGFITFSAS